MRGRLEAVLPAAAATLGMAALLGALATGTLELVTSAEGAPSVTSVLRSWALFSALALPLGFVFGIPLLAVVRSLRNRPRGGARPR